ncbi:nitrite extrusion protein 2 [Escherichia coli]|uniref:Nitrite extrusion protein 2 n=1 Tax=Escherichia coli TaxID=562 RepID=A0A376S8M0_ECOLX|nr:nitrite extrusion protein 2 [Escherichia coli]
MALQNEKTSRYLLRDWKPENPAFWENKGNILHEETSGYQSVVYFLPSVSGCYLAQLLLISINRF